MFRDPSQIQKVQQLGTLSEMRLNPHLIGPQRGQCINAWLRSLAAWSCLANHLLHHHQHLLHSTIVRLKHRVQYG